MSKYEVVDLKIDGSNLTNFESKRKPEQNKLIQGDVIYIYRNSKTNQVYIGQTIHFLTRHKQHFDGNEEKFIKAKFDEVLVLYSQYFNGSALNDVEAQLITYFKADSVKSSKRKSNQIFFEEDGIETVVNRTGGNDFNSYRDEERVSLDVILPFWSNILYKRKWVSTETIEKLRSHALVKYSPIKHLTEQQNEIINEIINNPLKSYVVNGDAGTGKTVLLTNLVGRILSRNSNLRIAVVVQSNWEDTAKEIFKVYGIAQTNLVIGTSTKIINNFIDNENTKFDIIIVDEAHKLSRRGSKQLPAFNSVYKDQFADFNNHLEILNEISNQVILLYDILQSIRPANINRRDFYQITKNYEKFNLSTQLRIKVNENNNFTSDDYINGIKYLLYKDTGLLDEKYTNFNPNFNRGIFRENTNDSYFGFFDEKPMKSLFNWIDMKRNDNPAHVCRVLGGLVEPWKVSDGKDINKKQWHEDNLHKRWNSTQKDWVNSKDEDAEDQIGSVFAVQGVDLNEVGVLVGNDLNVDEKGILFGDSKNFQNTNGKFNKDVADIIENKKEFTLFVLNIYYVLLTRGIDGVRIGFWNNEPFKNYFKQVLLQ